MLGALMLAATLAAPVPAVSPPPDSTFRFVVLGHIRGGSDGTLSPKLAELLDEVRALKPRLVVLPGDIIWGEVQSAVVDPARVDAQWQAVDSALATLGVPVLRAPGNHDIAEHVTRDVWFRRYGTLPRSERVGNNRFIALSSAWIPAPGDTVRRRHIRGVDIDSAQVEWLRQELATDGGARHTFVVMHHLLWWAPDSAPWWREVHPLLARAGVRAVFSGDYGPMKFSHLTRDGVHYYQNSIETPVLLPLLQNNIRSRLLSSQFDNYLEVNVRGGDVRYTVHTIAEESSGEFTPARWRDVNEPPQPPPTLWSTIVDKAGGRRRLAIALAGMAVAFGAGWWWGRRA
jgi:3',5'-cyclic AMP phosphodiesterase CpdA